MNRIIVVTLIGLIISGCNKKNGSLFNSISSDRSGIEFANVVNETDDLNILDYLYFYNGGGLAVGDINNDGLPDVFFSANQGKNKLYLNKGNLQFDDISSSAKIEGNSDWNTGSIMIDINNDGYLDIYVTAVVGIKGFDGHNELYINNKDNTFSEKSAVYKLDFDTYSSSTAFLDFDKDGDLDLFLLNHAVHTQNSFGNASLREERNYETGDRLLRNDGGVFKDVSEQAGIYGGINGYGLGVAVSDFNHDGYPDIYVGNDFHEDDYYYLNQGNGTFRESLKDYFGHTSRFSMGNDVADINHDGWSDLISLDMLPEDEQVLKSSEGDDNIQTMKMRTERYGYHYQYTRNMLFVNQQDADFMETALLSGVAATDWSWSALIEDFNQDGEQDIFISNGIPKRPNDLDFIRFVSSEQIQNKINETKLVDQKALDLMPSGKIHNYIFQGSDDLRFIDRSGDWIVKDTLVSGATAFADLDNDGDLDLLINNLNNRASLLENKTDDSANFLKIRFKYNGLNPFGIGTKVFSYHQGITQYKELYTVRGFQASSEPIVHFGYGEISKIDSLKIVWPDNSFQILKDVAVNQQLTLEPLNTRPFDYSYLKAKSKHLFSKVDDNLGIDFIHKEDGYIDFNRQKLIPFQVSGLGPAFAYGDLNHDGRKDLFFGGSKFSAPRIYMQQDSSFSEIQIPSIRQDSIKEDVSAVITDLNSDGRNDLMIGSGGADFFGKRAPLLDSYFIQTDTTFVKNEIKAHYENASVVRACDFDQDGDIDIFVGNHVVTNDYGQIPSSYLLLNSNGKLTPYNDGQLNKIGMLTDAIWSDYDGDGDKDLIVVGEWMAPQFFNNSDGELKLVDVTSNRLNGLWQDLIEFDLDGDGDLDYLLGNWGTNTKFRASEKAPLKMYYNDFDGDGQTETIVANNYKGAYYPLSGLDELGAQMVGLRKKFTAYKDFAGQPLSSIFESDVLKTATVFEVHTLNSGYLKNEDGKFTFKAFPNQLQVSPIQEFLSFDFDEDGQQEVLAGGNFFGVTPYHGRFDSFTGALIKQDGTTVMGHELGLDFSQRSVRHLSIIELNKTPYLLVTFNDSKAEVYRINDIN
ncbi:MAG: VCBS repeat-containing protein [Flavobacteriaceae bacterium]|nr:VCBS repeat-containing protein [Flavobacteriaceae bacterium]